VVPRYIDDEELARLIAEISIVSNGSAEATRAAAVSVGTVYGSRLIRDRGDTKQLAGNLLLSLVKGEELDSRSLAFIAWILNPMLGGDDPTRLPFQPLRSRGQKKTKRGVRHDRFMIAIAVRSHMVDGMSKEIAVADCAKESGLSEDSVRGSYQDVLARLGLIAMEHLVAKKREREAALTMLQQEYEKQVK
jgi:hypothetical protein